jgi:predicted dehydrogenase
MIEVFESRQDARVTAICDIDDARLREVGDRYSVEERYSDFADLAGSEIEIIQISTPIQCHGQQAIQALRSGKHVLSQYVAANGATQARELLDAWRDAGRKYMFVETDCYERRNMAMIELASRGVMGEPTWGRGCYVHDCRALGYGADGALSWRGELWRMGLGGVAAGVHTCMPLIRVFDERVESVHAVGSGPRNCPEFSWSDSVNAICRFPSGRWIEIQMDIFSVHPGCRGYFLQGTRGCFDTDMAYCGLEGEEARWRGLDEIAGDIGFATKVGDHRSAFELCVSDFMDSVRKDVDPPYGILDALHVTAIGWAIDGSLSAGKDAPVKDF